MTLKPVAGTTAPVQTPATMSLNGFDVTMRSAFNAGFCALIAHTFSLINPATAAVFGATSSLARNGLRAAIGHENNVTAPATLFKTAAKTTLVYSAALAIGTFLTEVIGYSLTSAAAFKLSLAMYLSSTLIVSLAMGCLCCGVVAGGLGLSSPNTAPTTSPSSAPAFGQKV